MTTEGEVFDLEPVFNAISANTKHVPGFDIEHRWILGNFAFQKMAIVNDLKNLLDALAGHDLVAAIAGDAGARVRARGDRCVGRSGRFRPTAAGGGIPRSGCRLLPATGHHRHTYVVRTG